MATIEPELKKVLERQHYSIVGTHSAVKICEYTKKSLRDEDTCYKNKFYGINSHQCVQMTPALNYCSNFCTFCWRPLEYNQGQIIEDIDGPEFIVEESVKAFNKLLNGFKGNVKANQKKYRESRDPQHFAISLTGEPTIYPKIKELVDEVNRQGKTSFLVTNGMYPEQLENITPTQLYVSIPASNELSFLKIDRPRVKNAWAKLLQSLDILNRKGKEGIRTVMRVTVMKGMNMDHPEEFAELVKRADPWFIEVKSYMWVGYSQDRLKQENMPEYEETKAFGLEIAKHCGYRYIDGKSESRVILLMKRDEKDRWIQFEKIKEEALLKVAKEKEEKKEEKEKKEGIKKEINIIETMKQIRQHDESAVSLACHDSEPVKTKENTSFIPLELVQIKN